MSACLAAILAPGAEPDYPASYHWCRMTEAECAGGPHVCFCGKVWSAPAEELAKLTPVMRAWRVTDRSITPRE